MLNQSVDNVDRMNFDNWAEHGALYTGGKPVVKSPLPRAKSRRQIPPGKGRARRTRARHRRDRVFGSLPSRDLKKAASPDQVRARAIAAGPAGDYFAPRLKEVDLWLEPAQTGRSRYSRAGRRSYWSGRNWR